MWMVSGCCIVAVSAVACIARACQHAAQGGWRAWGAMRGETVWVRQCVVRAGAGWRKMTA